MDESEGHFFDFICNKIFVYFSAEQLQRLDTCA